MEATTTTSRSNTLLKPEIDINYPRSTPGLLKIAQMALTLIGFICCACSWLWYGKGWYEFVTMMGFWLTACLFLAYLFHVIEKLPNVPWLLIELIYDALWAFFLLVASAILCRGASYDGARVAAVVFGFLAMIAYGIDGYYKYQSWRAGEFAQAPMMGASNSATVTRTTTTVHAPPPGYASQYPGGPAGGFNQTGYAMPPPPQQNLYPQQY